VSRASRRERERGAFAEPSDGLEPSTPSLPSRPRGWRPFRRVHGFSRICGAFRHRRGRRSRPFSPLRGSAACREPATSAMTRVPYRTAGAAARAAFRKARQLGCGLEELATLQAVVSLTALYSKLEDHVSHAQLAMEAGLHPRNARRALSSLAAKGLISYEPGRGRGNLSWVGLPSDEKGADRAPYSSRKEGRSGSEKGADSTLTREQDVPRRTPRRSALARDDDGTRHILALEPAVAMACGFRREDATASELERVSRAAMEIAAAGGTATDVELRARAWRRHKTFGDMVLTPTALARNWAQLASAAEAELPVEERLMRSAARREAAARDAASAAEPARSA